MMERGEPYMMIEKTLAATPQKTFLIFPWRAKTEARATAAKSERMSARRPPILSFSFLGA